MFVKSTDRMFRGMFWRELQMVVWIGDGHRVVGWLGGAGGISGDEEWVTFRVKTLLKGKADSQFSELTLRAGAR